MENITINNGIYAIQVKNSDNKVFDILHANKSAGARLIVYPNKSPNYALHQRFYIRYHNYDDNDNTYYTIAALHSTRDLNVAYASLENGAEIMQFGWRYNGYKNEWFHILDGGEGYVKIVAKLSSKVLTVKENGYVVQQDDEGFDNQRFKLINCSEIEHVREEYDKLSILPFNERDLMSGMNVKIQILWLFYSNVKTEKAVYEMTADEKRSYLISIGTFKGLIESWTNNNVEIVNEVKEISRVVEIKEPEKLLMPINLFESDLAVYCANKHYDCVITVSSIDANNVGLTPWGGMHEAMPFEQGYFTLANGWKNGTDNTQYFGAIHEFLHVLEGSFRNLGFFMPRVDIVDDEIKNYYESKHDGWLSFYRDYLTANVKHTDKLTGKDRFLGIFPSMWEYFSKAQNVIKQNR